MCAGHRLPGADTAAVFLPGETRLATHLTGTKSPVHLDPRRLRASGGRGPTLNHTPALDLPRGAVGTAHLGLEFQGPLGRSCVFFLELCHNYTSISYFLM